MAADYPILLNERELISRIAEGDELAFSTLFHHYNQRIFPFVFKMVKSRERAEEIVQDVFTRIWTRRASLMEVQHFTAYLFTIASNRTLDELRKIATESKHIKAILQYMDDWQRNTIEEWMDEKETAAVLQSAINQLSPQRKQVYTLCRIEGKSYKEAAEILQISVKTVQAHLVESSKQIISHLRQVPGTGMAILFWLLSHTID